MAFRIDDAIVRGEIDNTVEGRTTGHLWLAGRAEPVTLDLDGDCWRDLAGSRLVFENPEPKPDAATGQLAAEQTGVTGDITASRKARVSTVSEEQIHAMHAAGQEIPYEWKHLLYLEWFSPANGRVLIESSSFHLTISTPSWAMDEDAEQAQQLANLHAMRDFMAGIIRRRNGSQPAAEQDADELDEYEWEERLKESDRLADAYQEVLEKYMDDEDAERKEAFVMGWDGLLDALAERDENDIPGLTDDGGFSSSSWTPDDGGEGPEDREDDRHPLQAMAYEVALRSVDLVSRDGGPDTAAHCLVSNLLQVSAKLAGALNGCGSGYEPEAGFVLAVLKRCLNWLNEAMAACQALLDQETDPDQAQALTRLRQSVFEIRDGIVALRRELKQS
ncbi:hypothetical protein KBB96_17680 [Luteolibacter ambystomatis]|uniref:Uncharacterized protein n=1 Tax=Luteolibacter ambystomatis TaxID=2824561 RepID=A0A975G8C4_9BACT|nr:hypothetical protein [Luteolibacter ambystomatis]QUE50677.1 hypothetical protein KBB96_17680 [Luteolibacter ambystomatis]